MHAPFSRLLEVERLAMPQLSASDSCVPAFFHGDREIPANQASSFRESEEDAIDFRWCEVLADSTDLAAVQPVLLDMFGLWEGQNCCALLADAHNHVKKQRGVQAAQDFYSRPAVGYLVTTGKSWKFVRSASHARKLASEAVNCFLVVRLPTAPKRIRRISWRREGRPLMRTPASSPSFQHDLRRFQYAGRLLKSSFSPYLPYRSVLRDKLPEVSGSHAARVIGLLLRQLTREKLNVQAMTVHLLEDVHGAAHLLAVPWMEATERQRHTVPPVMPSPSLPSATPKHRKGTRESAQSLFSRPIIHPPYINLSDIQQQNISLYRLSECIPPQEVRHCKSQLSATLSEVAAKLDTQRNPPRRVSTKPLDYRLLSAVKEACRGLDDLLGPFLEKHSAEDLCLALGSPKNYFLAKKLRQVHRSLAISGQQFQHFADTLDETLQKSGIAVEERKTITSRLQDYRQEIVTE